MVTNPALKECAGQLFQAAEYQRQSWVGDTAVKDAVSKMRLSSNDATVEELVHEVVTITSSNADLPYLERLKVVPDHILEVLQEGNWSVS